MLIRAIALSLALLIGIGTIVPLATEYAQAGPRKHKKYKRHHKRYKKYSKAWWRQYRARQRNRRAMAARRRALRLHQIRLENARKAGQSAAEANKTAKAAPEQPGVLPSGQAAPASWKRGTSNSGELQFRVDNNAGAQIGAASISVVGPAMSDAPGYGRAKTVGGVPTTSLRREVIDRMIRENGWVVNDYQKEIGGHSVYVVVAQSQGGNGQVNSRTFYFTEANGRIYSVATTSGANEAERLAEESEKVINSLQARPRPTQQASLKPE